MAIVNMWIFPLNFYCQTYAMRSNLHLINATVNNVAEFKAMDKIHCKAKHNHRKDYFMLLAPSLCLNYFCGYGKKNEQPKNSHTQGRRSKIMIKKNYRAKCEKKEVRSYICTM